jgi:hypothetical protein
MRIRIPNSKFLIPNFKYSLVAVQQPYTDLWREGGGH